jgi:ferritin-like metal-binding protein YciE
MVIETTEGVEMALLGETIETPDELFVHKLGAALTMEQKILEALPKLEEKAQDPNLRQQLNQHYRQTEGHVQNLHQVFSALGEEAEEKPCPAIEGLTKEADSMLGQVDESLNDAVILSAVMETEHHEIAVYDGLIIKAEQMGDADVIALLNENIEQEDETLKKAMSAAEQLAKKEIKQPA